MFQVKFEALRGTHEFSLARHETHRGYCDSFEVVVSCMRSYCFRKILRPVVRGEDLYDAHAGGDVSYSFPGRSTRLIKDASIPFARKSEACLIHIIDKSFLTLHAPQSVTVSSFAAPSRKIKHPPVADPLLS